MKLTTPFQCFRKPDPEAAATSGDTLQTDDRDVNIIKMTENETEVWYYPKHGTENEADAIVMLLGRVYVVITAGDCWHIRTMSDFNKQKVNI